MRTLFLLATGILVSSAPVHGQSHDHNTHSPYAGLQDRAVKALSPEEIEGLLAGDGLGFALAAELNGLPGPKHVLEMAEALGLTEAQKARTEVIRETMSSRAQELGRALVEGETHLDRMLEARHATAQTVLERTLEIGRIRGELRAVHLNAHLEMVEVLNPDQVEEYVRLRGYAGPS